MKNDKKRLNIALPQEEYRQLAAIAEMHHINVTEAIRRGIRLLAQIDRHPDGMVFIRDGQQDEMRILIV